MSSPQRDFLASEPSFRHPFALFRGRKRLEKQAKCRKRLDNAAEAPSWCRISRMAAMASSIVTQFALTCKLLCSVKFWGVSSSCFILAIVSCREISYGT